MTVKSDLAYAGDKELKEDWPITEGLDLGTTKISGRKYQLESQGLDNRGTLQKSNVSKRNKVML